MDYISILTEWVTRLGSVTGVQTVSIGLEPGMAPEDYPVIRLVPFRITPGGGGQRRKLEVSVYFGVQLHEFESGGLSDLYQQLADMEAEIISLTRAGDGWRARHVDTIFDEDRLESYKVGLIRMEVEA